MNKELVKCVDCWRVYEVMQLTDGPYESCICGCRKFRSTRASKFNSLRRFLTDWKYFCFGEKAYEA